MHASFTSPSLTKSKQVLVIPSETQSKKRLPGERIERLMRYTDGVSARRVSLRLVVGLG